MSSRPGRRALLRAVTCLLLVGLATPAAALPDLPGTVRDAAESLTTGKTTRAGVATVDASWHLGAGGGQFAEDVDSSGVDGRPARRGAPRAQQQGSGRGRTAGRELENR